MKLGNKLPYIFAALAAVCYGVSSPLSKLLLAEIPPAFLAALLYLGAGIGMAAVSLVTRIVNRTTSQKSTEAAISKSDFPYLALMVALDIAAPILLMFGLNMSAPANVSLLNNFEIVATSLIALFIFKEAIGKRMWIAIALITVACVLLSFDGAGAFDFSFGSLFVIGACLCWGFENNCTRKLSAKNPVHIVVIKGLGSGGGALIVAFVAGGITWTPLFIGLSLLLGFFAYGLSVFFYVKAQRTLGAARTSAFYAIAPFIGVTLSFIVFWEGLTWMFGIALIIMIAGAYLTVSEKHRHKHVHDTLTHDHKHSHSDGHHNHSHDEPITGEHSHEHTHEPTSHEHPHTPDLHHNHSH